MSAIPPPTTHRTEAKKSEADQAAIRRPRRATIIRPRSPRPVRKSGKVAGVGTGETAIENADLESEEKLLRVSV